MNEIASYDPDSSAIDLLPAQRPPSVVARQMLLDHAENMQTAYQLAAKMVNTTMVPTRFQGSDKADDATAAILYGSEIGLNPIQSLQRVIPIHGMPSIEARTMVALLTARGYRVRTTEQSNTAVTVEGVAPNGETATSTWTMERAVLAGYCPIPVEGSQKRPWVKTDWQGEEKSGRNGKYYVVNGNMKYITDPQAMLKAKAQSEVCRDLAPDVLMGISYSSEELSSERWDGTISVEPARQSAPSSGPITVDEIIGDEPPVEKPKRTRPSGTRPRKPAAEPAEEPQDAEVFDAPSAPEPPAEPDAAAPAADADPEPAPAVADAERDKQIRKLFVLLAKAEISDREDRLTVYRRVFRRDEISSTNDLAMTDLDYLVGGLESHDRKGDLAEWANNLLNEAALDEAAAASMAASEPTTTEGDK